MSFLSSPHKEKPKKRLYTVPLFYPLERIAHRFSPFEWVIFLVLLLVLFGSSLTMLLSVNNAFLVEVPARGGILREGIVGLPRFVNPLLAISDADRDLVSLVYSGLMRGTEDGTLIPDLAESYEISEDGLTFTFTLREDLTFHDGSPLTADDVIFTIAKAQDPALKSPKRANWDGVVVQKIDDRTIMFTLEQVYAPFLENTTLGILPAHIWKQASSEEFPFSQFNSEPIGSGPFRVAQVDRTSSGIPERYRLVPFADSALGQAYIASLHIHFYGNTDALIQAYRNKEIDSTSGLPPEQLGSIVGHAGAKVLEAPLSRLFAVFFNQNQNPIFADRSVREALSLSLDKEGIVNDVLLGYGSPIEGPTPLRERAEDDDIDVTKEDRLGNAKSILERGGWEFSVENRVWEKEVRNETQQLSFSLLTGNAPELKQTAERIKEDWEALGISVDIQYFEPADLQQGVIRPRKYDSLLFGMIVGREMDLFAFWHSSQRNDPGLNVAMYANIEADSLLEEARETTDTEARDQLLRDFEKEIAEDIPAAFVYAPDFVYVTPIDLKGVSLGFVVNPSDRFLTADRWYINTEHVWTIFQR
jgi:peptide/nickel transport system substrate-binding protein